MTKEILFWNWFKDNSSKYYYLNQIPDVGQKQILLDELLSKLHSYCDKLFFQIGGFPNEPQELIISADGNIESFEKVEKLISSAPQIDDWKIIAFKPPTEEDFVIEYEGIKLDPHEIWFLPLDNENNSQVLGLKLCLPEYTPQTKSILLEACYQLLDSILGEKSSALDIQYVEIDELPRQPEENGLIELTELPKYIQWIKTKV